MFDTNATRVGFETLRSKLAAAVPANYTNLVTAALGTPLQHAIRALKIYNNTNQTIFISFDGINDHEYAPAGTAWVWDFSTNREDPSGRFELPRYTQVYVRYNAVAPTTNEVVLVVIYGAVN